MDITDGRGQSTLAQVRVTIIRVAIDRRPRFVNIPYNAKIDVYTSVPSNLGIPVSCLDDDIPANQVRNFDMCLFGNFFGHTNNNLVDLNIMYCL